MNFYADGAAVGSRRIAQEEQLAAPVKIRPFSRDPGSALYDRPCFAGDRLVYVSTREPLKRPRESWTAVFSTDLKTGFTNRITPHGVTDYSPSVSPSGLLWHRDNSFCFEFMSVLNKVVA